MAGGAWHLRGLESDWGGFEFSSCGPMIEGGYILSTEVGRREEEGMQVLLESQKGSNWACAQKQANDLRSQIVPHYTNPAYI
jgi:hypothetical protein